MSTRKIVSLFIGRDTAGIVLDYLINPRRTSRKIKRVRQREDRERQDRLKTTTAHLYLLNTFQGWLRMGYESMWIDFLQTHLKMKDKYINAAAQAALERAMAPAQGQLLARPWPSSEALEPEPSPPLAESPASIAEIIGWQCP